MKFSLFKNDKSTMKDELLLLGFIVSCFLVGAVLLITKPSFWIVDQTISGSFGLLMVLTGVLLTPSLIYRFMTNDEKPAE